MDTRNIRICCLSDTHGFHREAKIPECDLLLFAGDMTNQGEIEIIADFNRWLGELGIPSIVIAGNHDLSLEKLPGDKLLTNATYLMRSSTEFQDLKIYGSPMSPKLGGWAFGYERNDRAKRLWEEIPDDTDILLSHGPPLDILDEGGLLIQPLGCADLKRRTLNLKLKLHVFGHIHESHGRQRRNDTIFVNASYCGWPDYSKVSEPILVSLER